MRKGFWKQLSYEDKFDMAFDGETVIVSRKENKNVVIISEAEYNELAKAK